MSIVLPASGLEWIPLLLITRTVTTLLADSSENFTPFLGDNLLPWLLLAFGAAMVVGNLLALLRPPRPKPGEAPAPPPPLGRVIGLVAIGAVAAIWALASLLRS